MSILYLPLIACLIFYWLHLKYNLEKNYSHPVEVGLLKCYSLFISTAEIYAEIMLPSVITIWNRFIKLIELKISVNIEWHHCKFCISLFKMNPVSLLKLTYLTIFFFFASLKVRNEFNKFVCKASQKKV